MYRAAKEQQQQEFYALSLSSKQAMKNDTLPANFDRVKNLKKTKGIDLWVPSKQYIDQLTGVEDRNQPISSSDQLFIPNQIIDKVFFESRSRANFAKNFTFAIFSAEERKNKNCTGRVFGRAQLKGQLDQAKLQKVKEVTFRKYPCHQSLIDITWRKECITAIDSGLRNENRSSKISNDNNDQGNVLHDTSVIKHQEHIENNSNIVLQGTHIIENRVQHDGSVVLQSSHI